MPVSDRGVGKDVPGLRSLRVCLKRRKRFKTPVASIPLHVDAMQFYLDGLRYTVLRSSEPAYGSLEDPSYTLKRRCCAGELLLHILNHAFITFSYPNTKKRGMIR